MKNEKKHITYATGGHVVRHQKASQEVALSIKNNSEEEKPGFAKASPRFVEIEKEEAKTKEQEKKAIAKNAKKTKGKVEEEENEEED